MLESQMMRNPQYRQLTDEQKIIYRVERGPDPIQKLNTLERQVT